MAWHCGSTSNAGLIRNLCSARLINNSRVAEAMTSVDRANYVSAKDLAYEDSPQQIGFGATISAPHMHAHAAEELLTFCADRQPDGSPPRVLDVGSGSGYTAAVFFRLLEKYQGASVVGIDHIDGLVQGSIASLRKDGLGQALDSGRIKMVTGDGRQGYPAGAPYSAIHVGAAAPNIPQALLDQLAKPGRLFIPVEDHEEGHMPSFGSSQAVWSIDKLADGSITRRKLFGVRYVPLTDSEKQWAGASSAFS